MEHTSDRRRKKEKKGYEKVLKGIKRYENGVKSGKRGQQDTPKIRTFSKNKAKQTEPQANSDHTRQ